MKGNYIEGKYKNKKWYQLNEIQVRDTSPKRLISLIQI